MPGRISRAGMGSAYHASSGEWKPRPFPRRARRGILVRPLAMASNFEMQVRPSRQDALDYHSSGRKGKIEVVPPKPVATSRDLSLAYSPGVAEPCLEIAGNADLS